MCFGGGNAKETNKLLAEQQKRTAGYTDTIMNQGNSTASYNNDQRGFITDQYKNLLNGVNTGGGGGGGGGYVAQYQAAKTRDPYADLNYNNNAQGTYQDFMNTGGYNDDQMRDFRSRGEAVIPSFYAGIKRNMDENAAVRGGGYAGYSGQMAKAGREGAQQAEAARLNTEGTLQDQIRQNKMSGAAGVSSIYNTGFDFSKQKATSAADQYNREQQQAADAFNQQQQAQASASRAAASNQQASLRDKMSILNAMQGMRTEGTNDLDYYNTALKGSGLEQNDINNRIKTPTLMDNIGQGVGIAGKLIGGVAGAATGLGATGNVAGGLLTKKPKGSNVSDYTGLK